MMKQTTYRVWRSAAHPTIFERRLKMVASWRCMVVKKDVRWPLPRASTMMPTLARRMSSGVSSTVRLMGMPSSVATGPGRLRAVFWTVARKYDVKFLQKVDHQHAE